MQPSLSFARITAHDAALQRQRIAQEVAALPAHVAPAPAPKRPVGRPKRERDVAGALAEQPQQKNSRGAYTKWFASPYINDILAAYHKSGKHPKAAVKALQRDAPDDRYARLTNCTVAAWFINGELLPHLQNQLAANQAPRGNGPAPVFAAAPDVESVIVKTSSTARVAKCGTHV